jgi:hypothetical protein
MIPNFGIVEGTEFEQDAQEQEKGICLPSVNF